jgi:chorismate--pyruvate lyase
MHFPAHAHWRAHVNGARAGRMMRGWLTDAMSLTAKLKSCGGHFQVRRLHQWHDVCLADEAEVVGLSRRQMARERDVLLLVDGTPVVYAHTVVPLASEADWPFFDALGERSLGSRLFTDPLVRRGKLQYARLRADHPLMRRAEQATGAQLAASLSARRCLYRRRTGLLLVTELFLPAIAKLKPAIATNHYAEKPNNQ